MDYYLVSNITEHIYEYIDWYDLYTMDSAPNIIWKRTYDYLCSHADLKIIMNLYGPKSGSNDVSHRNLVHNFIVTVLSRIYPMQMPEMLWQSMNFVFRMLNLSEHCIEFAPPHIRNNRNFLLKVTKTYKLAYQFIDPIFRTDYELAIQAARYNPNLLIYVSKDLQSNRDLVWEVFKYNPGVHCYIKDPKILSDDEVMLTGLKNKKIHILEIDKSLRANAEFMLEVMKLDWQAIQYIEPELQNDSGWICKAAQLIPYHSR